MINFYLLRLVYVNLSLFITQGKRFFLGVNPTVITNEVHFWKNIREVFHQLVYGYFQQFELLQELVVHLLLLPAYDRQTGIIQQVFIKAFQHGFPGVFTASNQILQYFGVQLNTKLFYFLAAYNALQFTKHLFKVPSKSCVTGTDTDFFSFLFFHLSFPPIRLLCG